MAKVSTYLNFQGKTKEAFEFYKQVFGTEYIGTVQLMKDVPPAPDMPKLKEEEMDLVMHVALPILGGHVIMGTDAVESMGHKVVFGNNISINLEPDTRVETQKLFTALCEGGKIDMPLMEMFWGGYFGSLTDRYGVQWMFNCESKD